MTVALPPPCVLLALERFDLVDLSKYLLSVVLVHRELGNCARRTEPHGTMFLRPHQFLEADARKAIATSDVVGVSAASGWEAAIKQSIGKLHLAGSFLQMVLASDFVELPVSLTHVEEIARLPIRHADPFERMLVAQARVESATIVTPDRQFEGYDVPILWT